MGMKVNTAQGRELLSYQYISGLAEPMPNDQTPYYVITTKLEVSK
jgi:hypothetical protein